MRLFDKALTQSKTNVREAIEPDLRRCVVLNADRIAEDITQKNDRLSFADYPYCVPPWPICFVEWSEGKFQFGAIVQDQSGDNLELLKTGLNCAEAERGLMFMPMCWAGDLGFRCRGDLVGLATTRDGLVIATGIEDHITDGREPLDGAALPSRFCADYYAEVIGMAFTFANCRNVKLGDVTQRDEPVAKIRRRLHIPDVKRYTLYIDGKKNNPLQATGDSEHVDKRWHLCRGHFAEYTAERPLFGKLIGKFWVPQHQRGSKSVGVIEKGYAIKPTNETM